MIQKKLQIKLHKNQELQHYTITEPVTNWTGRCNLKICLGPPSIQPRPENYSNECQQTVWHDDKNQNSVDVYVKQDYVKNHFGPPNVYVTAEVIHWRNCQKTKACKKYHRLVLNATCKFMLLSILTFAMPGDTRVQTWQGPTAQAEPLNERQSC